MPLHFLVQAPKILPDLGQGLDDFRVLFFYPQFEGGLTVRSEVAKAIDLAFRKHGITIPFPQRDLYIKEHQLNESKPGLEKKK